MHCNMMDNGESGFREVRHTADVALQVWASSLEELFAQSARGMYSLLGIPAVLDDCELDNNFQLEAMDRESLLVAFLSELLFLLDEQTFAFSEMHLQLEGNRLQVRLKGCTIESLYREIKAVTYHQLAIEQSAAGYSVLLVFDI